jgi:ribosomal protein S18 acetylase RimI-like enzyme
MTTAIELTVHDEPWREAAAIVDEGLGTSNEQAAPLHEVQPLQCFVRTWGRCVELQQLWVQPERRGEGLGTRLIRAFEQRAIERGCSLAYLETFSFQAPALYRSLGYEVVATIEGYGDGIAKHLMTHALKAP